MKKILLTTLILILVPTLIFLPVYLYLIYFTQANAKDYSDDVLGEWNAIQYYYENERFACKDEVWATISFNGETIIIDGTVLEPITTGYNFEGGTSLKFEQNGKTVTYLLSFDVNNNLKIIIDGTTYIILLRRSEG